VAAPSNSQVEIVSKKRIFDRFFKIDEIRLRYMTFAGRMSDEITRLVFERGDSVAAVVHNQTTGTVYFAEQFRAPAYEKGPAWMLEIPAGVIDAGEAPASAIIREVEEEIGYRPRTAELIGTFYLSPGGSSERISVFYCPITTADQVGKGGGIMAEGEDIRIVELKVADVYARLDAGQFVDAKTIVGLQWLRLRKQ
jgi:ADP-ribose pyrophosphatase